MEAIDIKIFKEGLPFAARRWVAVPRVGDEIMLGPDNDKEPYRVLRVVWGVEGPKQRYSGQAVNIEVEKIEPA